MRVTGRLARYPSTPSMSRWGLVLVKDSPSAAIAIRGKVADIRFHSGSSSLYNTLQMSGNLRLTTPEYGIAQVLPSGAALSNGVHHLQSGRLQPWIGEHEVPDQASQIVAGRCELPQRPNSCAEAVELAYG